MYGVTRLHLPIRANVRDENLLMPRQKEQCHRQPDPPLIHVRRLNQAAQVEPKYHLPVRLQQAQRPAILHQALQE